MRLSLLDETFTASSFSVVVPCFNEARGIAAVLDRLLGVLQEAATAPYEVIAVDDGSVDETGEALLRSSDRHAPVLKVVTHEKNAGLTEAMKTGAAAAQYPTVVFLDSDLSYAPEVALALLEARSRTGAALAMASPYMPGGHVGRVPFVRLTASRWANRLLSLTVGGRIRTFTGMVRAYETAAFRRYAAETGGGEFNASMVARVLRAGLAIVEVPATLDWPDARLAEPSRLSLRALGRRTRLVMATVVEMLRSGKGWVNNAQIGSLVLVQRPGDPFRPGGKGGIL